MAATTYLAKGIRFCRKYKAQNLSANYAALSSAAESYQRLQSEPWEMIMSDLAPQLPPHTEAQGAPDMLDYYDTYTLCAEHDGVLHRAYAGMVAYRIALPDAAVSAGRKLVSMSIRIFSDPYNFYGARVAISKSDTAATYPTTDIDVIRTGLSGVLGENHDTGVAPRTTNVEGTRAYPANETITLQKSGGYIIDPVSKYLWVFLSLENYEYARNGWLEGSSRMDPQFTLVFDDAIAGYSAGDLIGGGYSGITQTLAVGGTPAFPAPNPQNYTTWPSLEVCFTSVSRATLAFPSATYATGDKLSSVSRALLAACLGNNGGFAVASEDYKLFMNYANYNSTNKRSTQHGLSATLCRVTSPSTTVVLTLSHYCMCVSAGAGKVPTKLSIKNPVGGSTINLNGARVQLAVWFLPSPNNVLLNASKPFWALGALSRTRDFWTAESASITGTINSGQTGATDITVDAELIGVAFIPDGMVAGAEIVMSVHEKINKTGLLVFAPFIVDPGNQLSTGTTVVGLSSMVSTAAATTEVTASVAGWLPEITLQY